MLDLHDIHPKNFMIDKKNRIYLVDEGALLHRIKGLGIAKAFLKWVVSPEKRQAFWQGYNSKHSSDYFDADYEMLINIIECVRAIALRTVNYKGLSYAVELKKLKDLCEL